MIYCIYLENFIKFVSLHFISDWIEIKKKEREKKLFSILRNKKKI